MSLLFEKWSILLTFLPLLFRSRTGIRKTFIFYFLLQAWLAKKRILLEPNCIMNKQTRKLSETRRDISVRKVLYGGGEGWIIIRISCHSFGWNLWNLIGISGILKKSSDSPPASITFQGLMRALKQFFDEETFKSVSRETDTGIQENL